MRKILLSLSVALITLQLNAQKIVPCKTDELFLENIKIHPELLKAQDEATKASINFKPNLQKKAPVRYIPVVFHVIHKNGLENISQAQINDCIRVLNEDFRKMAGTNGGTSTDPLAVDMEYEFRLAQLDPNGFPTSGVNRVYNIMTDNAGNSQKGLSYWDARKYFNVWVVNNIYDTDPNSMILGYAQFPFQISSQTSTDGIMVRADQVGVIEVGSVAQAGRTVTHEAGHWVGLYHPFQGGCVGGTTGTCQSAGDQVCDTPPVASAANGCPSSRNSCTNETADKNDLVKNYMDYADGNCTNMFTAGQKTRADGQMLSFRSNIFSNTNIGNAGLNSDGTYKPLAASSRKAPYSFDFSTGLNGTGWTLENYMCPGDSGWQHSTVANASGSTPGCMAAQNIKNWRTNIRNAVASPNIDISTLSSPRLSFKVAYAKRVSVSSDRLRVFISDNYGRTEVLLKSYTAAELETGAMSTNAFVPSSSEWKQLTLDLSAYKNYTNCRIRFELQSLRGNNIYLDDFSLAEPTSMEEAMKAALQFNLFPNPAADFCEANFTLNQTEKVTINLLDMQGRTVSKLLDEKMESGKQELKISLEGLATGLYFLEMQTQEGAFLHKIWVK